MIALLWITLLNERLHSLSIELGPTAIYMLKDHRPIWVRSLFLPVLIILLLHPPVGAAINVLPAKPATHQVVVRPIVARKDASNVANFMGTQSSEDYIKAQVGIIWSQLGVQITWLDEAEFTDSFYYDGSPNDYSGSSRPTGDLSAVLTNPGSPALSGNPIELNMLFVEISPGFPQLNGNTAAGYARVDRNGSTLYVGSNLLGWNGGRDVVASVIAHEIGHNLGLPHYQADESNLMYSGSDGDGEELIASQESLIFTNNSNTDGFEFLQPLPSELNFVAWAESYDLQDGPPGDDDNDHLSNAFEFLNGSSPIAFTPHPTATNTPQGLVWTLNKEAAAVEDGFSYLAESSTDLSIWKEAGTSGSSGSVLSDGPSSFSVRLTGGLGKNFIRFEAIIPPEASASPALPLLLQQSTASEVHAHSECCVDGCGQRTAFPD